MSNQNDQPKAIANPAKAFFVGMLTRDIELGDAILDLLDNCVDGVLRKIKQKNKKEKPYDGFWAEIKFAEDSFCIKDNCGGIPRDDAIKKAFRLGSPNLKRDKDLPTVGMYGIGMKRAIFKMGKSCTVTSRHSNEAFKVDISPGWLEDDTDWSLPLSDIDPANIAEGTTIEISDLHSTVKHDFSSHKSSFIENFESTVATHFSYIIHKGFKVKITVGNESKEILPKPIDIKFESPKSVNDEVIAPFLYKGVCNGVDVKLAVGFYREFPKEEEIEESLEGKSASSDNAGWTVICNDRVVLYNDKTVTTGWGEAGVPKYHTQFISIAGVVHFQSNDADKLPVTTTKRGINHNSETYLIIKNIMRDGLKRFTSNTHQWKTPSRERDELFRNTESVDVFEVFEKVPQDKWAKVSTKSDYEGLKFVPTLPSISKIAPSLKLIRFSRPDKAVRLVAKYLLDDVERKPSEVGEECFDYFVNKAKNSR